MSPQFTPRSIDVQNDKRAVVVTWGDGKTSTLPIGRLRGYCPCAVCQGHAAGDLKFIANTAAGIFAATPVGRYAIQFKFADGHDTGIYRFDMLRKLDPDELERWGPPERINQ